MATSRFFRSPLDRVGAGLANSSLSERREQRAQTDERKRPAATTAISSASRKGHLRQPGIPRSKQQTEWAVSSIRVALAQRGEGALHHDQASLRDPEQRMEFSIE